LGFIEPSGGSERRFAPKQTFHLACVRWFTYPSWQLTLFWHLPRAEQQCNGQTGRTWRNRFTSEETFMRENIGDTEQKVRMAIGSAAAAAAIFAPLRYKWKGVLSAVAVMGLLTGTMGYSPLKRVLGI
jgi:hypothetical protein